MNPTTLLIILPLVAGAALLFIKTPLAKTIALGVALLQLAITAYAYYFAELTPQAQFVTNIPWVESLGISYYVGMDGISLLLVMLTNFLLPLIILSSFRKTFEKPNVFYGLMLIMQSALVGVFVARDAFLFYIFWELALIPVYFICLLWGGENRNKITFKFFIYTLVGSLIMLIGIIYLFLKTDGSSFAYEAFVNLSLSSTEQTFLFWAFFLAFAIKMPVFPFHTWQPDTYTNAPAQGTMLLSGIMLKMGIYGVIRWMIPVLPDAMYYWGTVAIFLSITGIVYASVIAIMQKDFKRLIAYSSIAHVGLISAGIFTGTIEGLQGAIIQMLSHGLCAVGLFFIVDILYDRMNTHEIEKLGGIRNVAPQFALYFAIVMLGSVSLPLTSGFVGEYMLFVGVFKFNPWSAAVAGLTIILGAVYMLNAYKKIMLGETKPETSRFNDLYLTEKIVLIAVSFFILYMGIYPKTFLELSEPAAQSLIEVAMQNLSVR
ncbi:MAG: NADH-quinone oxidoreductase subunit M [Cytophagaceae bacterium]|nr:NADH-quinone oxidoreductase subunit M [Cytophagaceae bacterium]MDW8455971.1 NADH-quinone oxidoreductase subunit M [Cytophagaceae bacterium]